jgi:hypothetical protein
VSRLARFVGFWRDFVLGDDWLVGAGVVVAIGVTALAVAAGLNPWWLLPVAVVALLADSLRRARAS